MLTTLDFAADALPQVVANRILEAHRLAKVIHIRGLQLKGDLRDFYWQVFEQVGKPMALAEDATLGGRDEQRTGSYWMEVRYDPTVPDAYRHSSNAQPLHTDGSYTSPDSVGVERSENAVGYGFLGCVAMPVDGGATTFIDANDVVTVLREEDPDLLARLSEVEMPHARSGDRKVAKAIDLSGEQPLVNWNYYCVDPDADSEVHDLRERYHSFLENSSGIASHIKTVKMQPGDAVIWKDDYVLHGRESFDAERTSARFLWKTSFLIDA